MYKKTVKLPTDDFHLDGELVIPVKAKSLIIFLSGYEDQLAPANRVLAEHLQNAGYATLLFDLLTKKELAAPESLDIDLLKRRIITITSWLNNHSEYRQFHLAYIGISGGAAPAIRAAAELTTKIRALISISGRTDLAATELPQIACPTLLIAAEFDFHVIKVNQEAVHLLNAPKNLAIIPGASHSFTEPKKIELVAEASAAWFRKHLPGGIKKEETEQLFY